MHNTRYIVTRPGALPSACRSGLRSCERYAPYAGARQFSHHWPLHPFQRYAAPAFSNEIGSLFRLMDDFSRTGLTELFPTRQQAPEIFQPRFDVKENESTYELRGELAGVDASNVSIEFTDPQTLVIKGRSERESTTGQLPEASTVNAQAVTDAPEQAPEDHTSDTASVVSDSSYQRPSVADVDGEGNEVATPTSTVSAVAADAAQNQQPAQPEAPKDKYWVSERSVGEFARTFSFPARVDHDAVTASLKNGILNVVVPKAQAPETRKISIQAA